MRKKRDKFFVFCYFLIWTCVKQVHTLSIAKQKTNKQKKTENKSETSIHDTNTGVSHFCDNQITKMSI